MAPCHVTFVLPFYEDESDGDSHLSDFEDEPDLEEEAEFALEEDIILLEDNDNASESDSEPEEGTSFIDIEEFLECLTLEEPPQLPPAKIPNLLPNLPPSAPPKAKGYYNNGTRIQALTLQGEGIPAWKIKNITGIDFSTLSRIRKKAISRG
jgi:hypothetical protein